MGEISDSNSASQFEARFDADDLASFGYQQQLDRSLGSFSVFAAGFSYISILTGMFQLFYLGYGTAGPAFFWTWPAVLIGQILVALCFAELAGRYPLSGGVYQWAKHLSGPLAGWLTGIIYLLCLTATLAAVALALQNTLPRIAPFFHWIGDPTNPNDVAANAVVLGCGIIVISSVINAYGVKLLSVINNVGVFSEILGVVLLILLLSLRARRGPVAAVFDTFEKGKGNVLGYLGPFLAAAALTPSYVMYGFDTAGTLAEETKDPRRRAPRAILQALIAAGVGGLLLLLVALMAASDLSSPGLSRQSGGLSQIVDEALGAWSPLFLWDVVFAIMVCVMAVHSGIVRLVFALARDGESALSHALSQVSAKTHTPVLPTLLSGLAAALVLLGNLRHPKIVELVTSLAIFWANLAYFIVVALLLKERLTKRTNALNSGFRLGQFGMLVNGLAVVWSAIMVINVGWPRESVYGPSLIYQLAPIWLTASLLFAGFLIFWLARRRKTSLKLAVKEAVAT